MLRREPVGVRARLVVDHAAAGDGPEPLPRVAFPQSPPSRRSRPMSPRPLRSPSRRTGRSGCPGLIIWIAAAHAVQLLDQAPHELLGPRLVERLDCRFIAFPVLVDISTGPTQPGTHRGRPEDHGSDCSTVRRRPSAKRCGAHHRVGQRTFAGTNPERPTSTERGSSASSSGNRRRLAHPWRVRT